MQSISSENEELTGFRRKSSEWLKTYSAIIYLITNKVNDKKYVGITTGTLKRRWNHHICCSNSDRALSRAIEKYKVENFIVEEIETIKGSLRELEEREKYWIKFYGTFPSSLKKGYNMTAGGGGILGYSHTEETKLKMSIASKKFHKGPKAKKLYRKLSQVLMGHKISDETKKKLSDKGKIHNKGTRNPFYGKKHTKDSKEKSRQTHIANWEIKNKDLIELIISLKNEQLTNKKIATKLNELNVPAPRAKVWSIDCVVSFWGRIKRKPDNG